MTCFGLIAEEVAEVNPDLILRDDKGVILSVHYEQINAMLLNEFLKEHHKVEEQARKVQEQEATIAELKKDLRATVAHLTARLEEQAAQIQKVGAQLEVTKAAPQTVSNK
jgi:phage shock protein A